jgi:3-oxocholest-4-en-26-oate---CoA ligase
MTEQFNLAHVFSTIADALPDHEFLVWRDQRLTYAELETRARGIGAYLNGAGLGCHTERTELADHESGQDHVGLYLHNGNEYVESMIGSYRARVAPFNVSYRYVEDESRYLLADASARALIYHARYAPRVAAIRPHLPALQVLIQVSDESGNALLPGAVDYELATTTPVPERMPVPSPDDLYIIYTGGTTGMPKGVLWRQHDIFVAAMGGRPFGSPDPHPSYAALAEQARAAAGSMSMLMIPPFMHAAAQWATFNAICLGGRIVIPDDVEKFRPAEVLALAARERVVCIPTVGDAVARPLVEELEARPYTLPALATITNGAAGLTPGVRQRLQAALPHVIVFDGVGSSETGTQLSTVGADAQGDQTRAVFTAQHGTTVLAEDLSRVLGPGEGSGWLARRDVVPLGYLGDPVKSARTFPTVDGARWSVPGDRATVLDDGRIELLGRDSVTINSGGEKIFAEEVERAISEHPEVADVVVVGRPSARWGSEVVAIIQPTDGSHPDTNDIVDVCSTRIARYKIPKDFIIVDQLVRSPAGKADYRWAKAIAEGNDATAPVG